MVWTPRPDYQLVPWRLNGSAASSIRPFNTYQLPHAATLTSAADDKHTVPSRCGYSVLPPLRRQSSHHRLPAGWTINTDWILGFSSVLDRVPLTPDYADMVAS